MVTSKRAKPAAAGAVSELQIIERFGRRLGIQDSFTLELLQTAPRHLVFTSPVARGRSEVRYDGVAEVLSVSRQPLLDTARLLLSLGCKPDAIIARRRVGADTDDMRAPLVVAAKYTVDETKTVFAKWKPFCQSAASQTDVITRTPAGEVAPTAKSSGDQDRRRANRRRAIWVDSTGNRRSDS
jgi:hypothetical protein